MPCGLGWAPARGREAKTERSWEGGPERQKKPFPAPGFR